MVHFLLLTAHARNGDGFTATLSQFGDLGELGAFFSSLANELTCECFEIIALTPAATFTLKLLVYDYSFKQFLFSYRYTRKPH